jgi:hypothetical protein
VADSILSGVNALVGGSLLLTVKLVGLLSGSLVIIKIGAEALFLGAFLGVDPVGGGVTVVRDDLLILGAASLSG